MNISNIAVNGSSNGLPSSALLVGVFYKNTSGTVNGMAIFNQIGTGVGYSVLIEDTGPSTTISVLDCSVHDFDQGGISIGGGLTATVKSNVIVASTSFSGSSAPAGIISYSNGTIANNRIVTHPQPSGVSANSGISVQSSNTILNNTVENFTLGIVALGDSNTVTSNKVALASAAVVLLGSNNDVEHNSFTNLPNGGAAIDFNCTGTGNTVINNVVNDADWGIYDPHGVNTVAPNTFTNVANITSPTC